MAKKDNDRDEDNDVEARIDELKQRLQVSLASVDCDRRNRTALAVVIPPEDRGQVVGAPGGPTSRSPA
jgi:hypothetical protein